MPLKIAVFLFIAASALPGTPHTFSPEDLWTWREPSEARISPDGSAVVWVESWNDRAADTRYASLWFASTDGKVLRPFTEGASCDRHPRWSPNGARVAWISVRGGRYRIYLKSIASGGPVELANLDFSPLGLSWSPEGEAIAFTALVPDKSAPPLWAPPALLPFVRTAEPHVQLFVVRISGSGPPRQITFGDRDYLADPAWMPGGMVIVAAHASGVDAVQISSGAVKPLCTAPGRYGAVLVSPDGGKIGYLAADPRPQSYFIHKLYSMNADGSRARMLTGSLDRDVENPQWSSDSRTVYFTAEDRGSTHVYAARNDGTVRQVTSAAERLNGFSLAEDGRAACVRSSAASAGEVFTFTVDRTTRPVTVAAPNRQLLSSREIGAVEEFEYTSAGKAIQAWAVKPPGFDPSRKYPLLLDVHDAPRSMCGPQFDLRAQVFAASGFVVLCVNPRGTPGYGEEFGSLLRTGYPGDDYEDLMRGVDFMLSKSYVDSRRLAIAGGLLAAWAIGHTGRFESAVARRPVVDWAVDVTTVPDGRRRALDWMGAMPWEDPEQYVKRSPLFFANNFKTPTLILAGDPDPESDALYFALRERHVESVLVRLPRGRPGSQILEWDTVMRWLCR